MGKFQLQRGSREDLPDSLDEGDHYLVNSNGGEDVTSSSILVAGPNGGGTPEEVKGTLENVWAGTITGLDLTGSSDVTFGAPGSNPTIITDGIRTDGSYGPEFEWRGSGDQLIRASSPPVPWNESAATIGNIGAGWGYLILDDQDDDTTPPICLGLIPTAFTTGSAVANYVIPTGTYDAVWRLSVDGIA